MTDLTFNPHPHQLIGLEFPAIQDGIEQIGAGRELGMDFIPKQSVTMDGAACYISGPPESDRLTDRMLLMTLSNPDADLSALSVTRILGTVVNSSSFVTLGGGAAVVGAANAAEALQPGNNGYITIPAPAAAPLGSVVISGFTYNFGGNFPQRILNVGFLIDYEIVGPTTFVEDAAPYVQMSLAWNATTAAAAGGGGPVIRIDPNTSGPEEVFFGEINPHVISPSTKPISQRVWVPADVSSFVAGRGVAITLAGINGTWSGAQALRLHSVRPIVLCTEETRYAAGAAYYFKDNTPLKAPQWVSIPTMFALPGNATGYAVVSGQRYRLTLSEPIPPSGPNLLSTLGDSGSILETTWLGDAGRGVLEGRQIDRDSNGVPLRDRAVDRVYPLAATATISGVPGSGILGSQPYVGMVPSVVGPASFPYPVMALVDPAPAGSPNLNRLKFVAKRYGSSPILTVQVKAFNPTFVIEIQNLSAAQFDEFPELFDGWREVEVVLNNSFARSSATPLDVSFSNPNGTAHSNRWEIAGLSTLDPVLFFSGVSPVSTAGGFASTSLGGAAYPGSYVAASGTPSSQDLSLQLFTLSPAITGLSVAAAEAQVAGVEANPLTGLTDVDFVPFAKIMWGAMHITGFCAYEVQRRDEPDDEWHTIGWSYDYTIREFHDYESPFGKETAWRVRVCLADGTQSPWSYPFPATDCYLSGWATTPDASKFNWSQYKVIDIRADLELPQWSGPGAFGNGQGFVFAQSYVSGLNDASLHLRLNLFNNNQTMLTVCVPRDVGNGAVIGSSTNGELKFAPGSRHWVRARVSLNSLFPNQSIARFYYSDDGESWIPLSAWASTTAGSVGFGDRSGDLFIGAENASALYPITAGGGKLHEVQVWASTVQDPYNPSTGHYGIDTSNDVLLANPKYVDGPPGTAPITDDAGSVWTPQVSGTVWFPQGSEVVCPVDDPSPVRDQHLKGWAVSNVSAYNWSAYKVIDMRAKVKMSDWESFLGTRAILGNGFDTDLFTGQYLGMWLEGDGLGNVRIKAAIPKNAGANSPLVQSALHTFAPGAAKWVRVILASPVSGTTYMGQFAVSDDGETWEYDSAFGTSNGVGTGFPNINDPITIGAINEVGWYVLNGELYEVEIFASTSPIDTSDDESLGIINPVLIANPKPIDDVTGTIWALQSASTIAFPFTRTVVPHPDGGCPAVYFTSNQKPEIAARYPIGFDGSPEEEFQYPESEEVIVERQYMRDFAVVRRPLERSGAVWTWPLLVNVFQTNPELARRFKALTDLAWEHLPYVCVRLEDGSRWFAAAAVPTGRVKGGRRLHVSEVTFVEVTDIPVAAEVIDVSPVEQVPPCPPRCAPRVEDRPLTRRPTSRC